MNFKKRKLNLIKYLISFFAISLGMFLLSCGRTEGEAPDLIGCELVGGHIQGNDCDLGIMNVKSTFASALDTYPYGVTSDGTSLYLTDNSENSVK